jgi:hypothetical protein
MGPSTIDNCDAHVDPTTLVGASYVATLQSVYSCTPDHTMLNRVCKYSSRIRKREEKLLATLGIIAGAHSEGMLADLVVDMGELVTVGCCLVS